MVFLLTRCFYVFRQYDSAKFLLRITGEIYRHFIFRPGNLKCHTLASPNKFLHLCLYFRNEALHGRKLNSLISNQKPRIRAFSFENAYILMRVGLPFTLGRWTFSSTTHRFQNALGSWSKRKRIHIVLVWTVKNGWKQIEMKTMIPSVCITCVVKYRKRVCLYYAHRVKLTW